MKHLIKFNLVYFILRFLYSTALVKVTQAAIMKFGADSLMAKIGMKLGFIFGSRALKIIIIIDVIIIIFLLLRKIGINMRNRSKSCSDRKVASQGTVVCSDDSYPVKDSNLEQTRYDMNNSDGKMDIF